MDTIIEQFDTSVIERTTQQSPAQFDIKDKRRTGKQSKLDRTKPFFSSREQPATSFLPRKIALHE